LSWVLVLCSRARVGCRRLKHIRKVNTIRQYSREHIAQVFKASRFNPQLYVNFKELASKNGYTPRAHLRSSCRTQSSSGLFFRRLKTQPPKPRRGSCWLGSKRAITFLILRSYAFGFRPIRTLGCSRALMVFTFVNPGKHPPVISIHAAAGQLYRFSIPSFQNAFFSVRHSFGHSLLNVAIRVI